MSYDISIFFLIFNTKEYLNWKATPFEKKYYTGRCTTSNCLHAVASQDLVAQKTCQKRKTIIQSLQHVTV